MELERLQQNANKNIPLEQWGPYVSERQWGTVREDYSLSGDAWSYFPFEHSHCRAYMWGEDGLGGISDYFGNLCFCIALWNGNDAILKARPSTRRSIPVAIALDIERRVVVFGIRLPAYKRELMHFSLNSDWSFRSDALETPYPLG